MKEQFDILVDVVTKLEQAEITYMISGSTAMNYYVQPRMTRDIDIVVELNCNKINILKEFFELDFYLDEETIQNQVEIQGFFNIIHYQTAVKIDFVVKKNSPFRIEEFNRRQRIQIDDNVFAWFVTPEDLVLSKLIWAKDSHSEFQLRDISNLLNSKIKIEHTYLRKWANDLNVIELLKEVKSYE
jgi:hypothetical protein